MTICVFFLQVCLCAYFEEDGLQLPAVFPTVLLGEDDGVRWDAVVRHPAVALQHPDHDVWEAVLRLGDREYKSLFIILDKI